MIEFQQYDIVRIKAIYRIFNLAECAPGTELPEIGDIATIVEIYSDPCLGYELEGVNIENGKTKFLITIAVDDLDLELVTRVP